MLENVGVLVTAGAAGGWWPGRRWGHAGLHGGAGPLLLLLLGWVAGGGGAAAQGHVRGAGGRPGQHPLLYRWGHCQ